MSQAFEQLNEYLEKAQALKTALVLFEWDDATLAPKEAGTYTSQDGGGSIQRISEKRVKPTGEKTCGTMWGRQQSFRNSIQYCPRGKKGIRTSGVHSAGGIP